MISDANFIHILKIYLVKQNRMLDAPRTNTHHHSESVLTECGMPGKDKQGKQQVSKYLGVDILQWRQ